MAQQANVVQVFSGTSEWVLQAVLSKI